MQTTPKKQILIILFVLLLTAQLFSQSTRITILHTNDLHAQYTPLKKGTLHAQGGFKALHHFLNQERDEKTLTLDGGDLFVGTLLSKIEVHGLKGGGLYKLMNKMDYDAMVPGNHDFDHGAEALKQCVQMAQFDLLCANIFQGDSLVTGKAYKKYKKGSIQVGVIGMTTPYLPHLVAQSVLDNVIVKKTSETAKYWIQKIDPVTDLIILLTHQGKELDSLLATKIQGVDLIVGGHSHTLLEKPLEVNGILITQAGARCQYLGRLDIWVEDDAIVKHQYKLIPLIPPNAVDNSEFNRLVDDYSKQIDDEFGKVIGQLKTKWKRSRNRESNVGDFVADAIRQKVNVDFAVLNSGAVRKNLDTGPITFKDIYELLPFDNKLVTFQCNGEELLTLMKTNAKKWNKPYADMLQISGISYQVIRKDNGKNELAHPKMNGKNIKLDKSYTGVTLDYVLDGHAKKYLGFVPINTVLLEYELAETAIEAVQKNLKIYSKSHCRIYSKDN